MVKNALRTLDLLWHIHMTNRVTFLNPVVNNILDRTKTKQDKL